MPDLEYAREILALGAPAWGEPDLPAAARLRILGARLSVDRLGAAPVWRAVGPGGTVAYFGFDPSGDGGLSVEVVDVALAEKVVLFPAGSPLTLAPPPPPASPARVAALLRENPRVRACDEAAVAGALVWLSDALGGVPVEFWPDIVAGLDCAGSADLPGETADSGRAWLELV